MIGIVGREIDLLLGPSGPPYRAEYYALADHPHQVLNKLVGKEVYTSNDQVGGVKLLHTNGVTHLTAKNHLSGIYSIIYG